MNIPLKSLLAAGLSLGMAFNANAQTIYTGTTTGNAADAANWDNGLPVGTGANAEALFDGQNTGTGTLDLTLGGNIGVRNATNDDGSFFRFTADQTDAVNITASGAQRDINVRSSTTVSVFQLDAGAGAVTIGGGAQPIRFIVGNGLGLKSTTFTNDSSSLATFASNVSFLSGGGRSQNYVFNGTGTGGFGIGGPLQVNQSANDAAYTAKVTVALDPAASLTLSGDNSGMDGQFDINSGTVVVGSDNAVGTGAVNFNHPTAASAILTSDGTNRVLANQITLSQSGTLGSGAGSGDLTFGSLLRGSAPADKTFAVDGIAATITGAVTSANGGLIKAGDGTLILAGDSAATWTSGTVTHADGTLAVGHDDALGGASTALNINGGSVLRSADANARTLANQIILSTDVTLGSSGTGDLTFTDADVVGGSGSKTLTIDGITAEFTGAITGSGARQVQGDGTLVLSGDSSADMSGGWFITGDATLRAENNGALGATGNNITLGGNTVTSQLELAGGITLDQTISNLGGRAADAVALNNASGTNTIQNVITMGAGGVEYNINSDAGTLVLAGGIDAPSSGAATRNLNLSGAGDINVSGAISDVGSNPIAVLKTGAGTLSLGVANSFSEGLEIQNGTLVLGNNAALGSGTLDLRSNGASDVVTVRSDGNARTLSNDVTFSSAAAGVTVLGGAGTGDLTFTGNWNAGSIDKTLTVDSVTVDLQGDFNKTVNPLTKDGDGTLVISGNASSFGQTLNVTEGSVFIDGTLGSAGNGSITAASGTIIGGNGTVAGNLTIDAGGLLVFDTASTLDIAGTVNLDNSFGVDSLVAADGSAIVWSFINDGTYTIIGTTLSDFSNIGNFGSANAADIGGGRTAYFQNGSLELVVVPEPASYALLGGLLALGVVFIRRRMK